jgi:hypothetical protein
MEKHMLLVNRKKSYYITHIIWYELNYTAEALRDPNTVFVKSYKEIWEQVATGRDLTFEEVLDCLILDNQSMRRVEGSSWLLPVDLSVSEEKLLKVLNLAGLFLQTKKVYWLIPVLLSLISTVMEFCTPLRIWIYDNINLLFCYLMHIMCDPLPRSLRKQIYSLGKLVENLKPSNDINLKATRCTITAIIAGGAKVHTTEPATEALTLVPPFSLQGPATEATFPCDSFEIRCTFDAADRSCWIRASTFDEISVGCYDQRDFLSILTLVSSIARNGCGSLKSYGPNRQVRVRGLIQTFICYVGNSYPFVDEGNHFPPVFEMTLENVILD